MVNLERAAALGRLTEKRKELKEIDLKADGYITSVRNIISAYGEFKDMDMEKAHVQTKELLELKDRRIEVWREIMRLEEFLNG